MSELTPRERQLTLVATIVGSSLSIAMGTITNVALPAIQTDFAASAAGAQWIVNAYLLPVSALILLGGTLGDHYGRKKMFVLGLALFLLGSIGCALAPQLGWMLAGRATQGLGSALLAPNSLAIIGVSFAQHERGRAIGIWAAAGAVAGAIAPVAGGWLIDVASWRWAFALMILPAGAALAIASHVLRESRPSAGPAHRPDWSSAALITGSLSLLTWALIAAPTRGLHAIPVLLALGAGSLLAVVFVVIQVVRGNQAMVPPALFRRGGIGGISLLTLFLYAALSGLLLLLPYTLITGHRLSATLAGLSLLPLPIALSTLSGYAGRLADRLGTRSMLIAGPACVTGGFVCFALTAALPFNYWRDVLPGMVLVSLGMAASVAPLTTAVITTVDESVLGLAAGINNAISRLAGLLAVALLGFVLVDAGQASASAIAGRFALAAWGGALLAAAAAMTAALLIRPTPVGPSAPDPSSGQ